MKKLLSLSLLLTASAFSAAVQDVADGSTLTNGTFTAFYGPSGTLGVSATIQTCCLGDSGVGPDGSSRGFAFGDSFFFLIRDDTGSNVWYVENRDPSGRAMTGFEINLVSTAGAAFDMGGTANRVDGSGTESSFASVFAPSPGPPAVPGPVEARAAGGIYAIPFLASEGDNLFRRLTVTFRDPLPAASAVIDPNTGVPDAQDNVFRFVSDSDVAVPEPSTWMSGLLAGLALAARHFRRQR